MLTHRGLTNNARLAAEAIGMRAGETVVHPMPLFHVAGCGLLTLGLVQITGTHVLMPHFDPALSLELIETYRSVSIGGVPTMVTALLGHPDLTRRDLSSLRYALSGGATVPAELARRVEATLGIPFVITFAQTESSCSITATRPGDSPADRAETLGRPLPQTEVKITDPRTGQTCRAGPPARSAPAATWSCRATSTIPAATAAAIDRDGWLHTGDLGSMDQRGYCRIEGRIKEMIIRGGENIYPREIETVLLSHPAVTEAAVVGVADRFWGEVVGAVIRTSADTPPTAAELSEFCRGQLAAYKIPAHWHSPAPFPSPPQERSARTCSARNSPTHPDPPGLPPPAVSGSRGDAPPPVQLNDLEFDLLARLGEGPAPFQGRSPATPPPGGWPRPRGMEGIPRDTSHGRRGALQAKPPATR